jgi:leader peptidase (prepilin peptidase) / N-methyltransferase
VNAPEQRGSTDTARVSLVKSLFLCAVGISAAGASLFVAPGVAGLAGAALALTMLAIAVVDWCLLMIPNELSALAFALGIVALAVERWSEMPAPALAALVRCAAMATVFLAFRLAYRRLHGREGMGLGDVKLAGVAGIWLDWTSLPIVVEIAALSALGFVLSQPIFAKRSLDREAKLPFGAFLAPSIWLCWMLERWWS